MIKTLYLIGLFLITSLVANAQCLTFTTLASGPAADHTLGIRDDGTLWAWGSNSAGQLGDGTVINKNAPVQVGTTADWARISAGSFHSLGVKSDGTLWAWGNNDSGQLGNGTNSSTNTPTQIGSATNWVSVKAGAFHSLGIRADGTLWAWGINSNGELGNGNNNNQNAPVRIGNASDWTSISAGFSHSLGIRSDGSLWGWGDNEYGQLGDGSNADKNTPVQVSNGGSWLNVSGGGYHTLAIKSGSTLWTWGRNDEGQLGIGNFSDKNIPAQIGNQQYYNTISAGMYHSSRIDSYGRFRTWGADNYKQLGNGSGSNNATPTINESSKKWASATFGKFHSLGITYDGQTWAWGNNSSGQLGINSSNEISSIARSGCGGSWVAVSAYSEHVLAIKSDGTAWAWGTNWNGELGNGSTEERLFPVQIGNDADWRSLSQGVDHSLGLKINGSLWSWGNNYNGQLGNDSYPFAITLSPKQIGTDADWDKISASFNYSMAIKKNGTLWAWGDNSGGQLGIVPLSNQYFPVQVGTDNDWESVYAGYNFTFAIKKNGTLWGWGNNGSGQLGDGSNMRRRQPVQIGNETNWKTVSTGMAHTIAMKNDGTLWAWGWNYFGQLGDGTRVNKNTPTQIGTDNQWTYYGAGARFTAAAKADGTFWMWGNDISETRGPDGETLQRLIPSKIDLKEKFSKIVVGGAFCFGLKSDGTLWAWGDNDFGEFGNGTIATAKMPVQAAIIMSASKLSAMNSSVNMEQGQHNMFVNNSSLIATVTSEIASNNPIYGSVTAKVWIDAGQPEQYVKRHYEITPSINADSATGWVTLYFTQEDFDAFNARNILDLPSGPTDNTGIGNLLIEKRGGTSSNNSGRPGTYPGAPETIDPDNISWNADNQWWEVRFKSTGFSGFFVKTIQEALPVRLIGFTVTESENSALLKWKTGGEAGASHFDVERSADAINFQTIGQVLAAGNSSDEQNYTFTDYQLATMGGTLYYRLGMVDADSSYAFSRIQTLTRPVIIKAYPNPVGKSDILTIETEMPISGLIVRNIFGAKVPVRVSHQTDQKAAISIGNLPQGVYLLQFNSGGEVVHHKFVVE